MKTIAVVVNKGGVTKTSTVIHLSAYLAKRGKKVLVVDFDPQRNTSGGFGVPDDHPYTVLDMLLGKSNVRLRNKKKNLYSLAGSRELDTLQYDLNILKERLKVLSQVFEQEHNIKFDYCIIDCSPSDIKDKYDRRSGKAKFLPKLNQIALYASDIFVMPMLHEQFAMDGLNGFVNDVIEFRKKHHNELKVGGVFFNIVDTRTRNFKKYYAQLKKDVPKEYFLDTYVRKDVRISDAAQAGESIFDVDPNCRAADDYRKLCNTLLKKLN